MGAWKCGKDVVRSGTKCWSDGSWPKNWFGRPRPRSWVSARDLGEIPLRRVGEDGAEEADYLIVSFGAGLERDGNVLPRDGQATVCVVNQNTAERNDGAARSQSPEDGPAVEQLREVDVACVAVQEIVRLPGRFLGVHDNRDANLMGAMVDVFGKLVVLAYIQRRPEQLI